MGALDLDAPTRAAFPIDTVKPSIRELTNRLQELVRNAGEERLAQRREPREVVDQQQVVEPRAVCHGPR